MGKVKVECEGRKEVCQNFHLFSGQANSKLSYERGGFCVLCEWPTVLPFTMIVRNSDLFYTSLCKVFCISVVQIITNSQAYLHSR